MTRDDGRSWRKALLIGLAIVAAPILALNGLLAFSTVTSAEREVDDIAAEALKIAEVRLDEAATVLVSLGVSGVNDCSPMNLAAMRASAYRARYVAELTVVDAQGEPVCSGVGVTRVVRRVSPEHGTLNPDVTLSVVAVGGGEAQRFIRLQWRHSDGTGIRVLVPGEDIFPVFLRSRLSASFVAEAVMLDGTPIARKENGSGLGAPQGSLLPSVAESASSQRYPIRIDIAAPGSAIAQANASLFVYANIAGLVLAVFAAAIAVLSSRRSGGEAREIAEAIRRREFVPYYQPVIDITSGRLVGCEVMARWLKPDGQILPPGRFIPLAEASGKIFPMTVALMERARDDLGELYAERPTLKLGFNLCAGHFDDVAIVADVERIFTDSPIRMTQLMFEVTERQPLTDIPRARLVIGQLQALGARVALDDVGTGHGGLSYLLKLGVDVMKMDKMFVDAIGTDRYSVAIIDSMVKLADDMNLDLIAEGVETFEQVERLREKGIRMAQGYVFAPPLPASSFRALVEAMAPPGRREAGRAKADVAGPDWTRRSTLA